MSELGTFYEFYAPIPKGIRVYRVRHGSMALPAQLD